MVDDVPDLLEYVLRIYPVSYTHYIIGLKNNFKKTFLYYCWGLSSDNVTLSLMDLGYVGAASAINKSRDHYYTIVPFVIENPKKQGVVVVDPTSDQLWQITTMKPRNMVFVVFDKQWEYRTEWGYRSNLYPECIMGVDTLRKRSGIMDNIKIADYHQNPRAFIEAAWKNPLQQQNRKKEDVRGCVVMRA